MLYDINLLNNYLKYNVGIFTRFVFFQVVQPVLCSQLYWWVLLQKRRAAPHSPPAPEHPSSPVYQRTSPSSPHITNYPLSPPLWFLTNPSFLPRLFHTNPSSLPRLFHTNPSCPLSLFHTSLWSRTRNYSPKQCVDSVESCIPATWSYGLTWQLLTLLALPSLEPPLRYPLLLLPLSYLTQLYPTLFLYFHLTLG